MAKSSIKVTKTNTYFKTKSKKNAKKGNPNKCPICGKFMGSGKKSGQRSEEG